MSCFNKQLTLVGLSAVLFICTGVPAQEPVTGVKDPEALFTSPDPKLHANKQVVMHIVRDLLEAGHWSDAPKYLTQRYIQHNPNVASGLEPVMRFFSAAPARPIPYKNNWKTKVVSVVAERDLVIVATVRELPHPTEQGKSYSTTWFDMWRIKDGKADEHWDGATINRASPSGGSSPTSMPAPQSPPNAPVDAPTTAQTRSDTTIDDLNLAISTLPAPVQMTTEQDHLRMMRLLGITSLRPGPSGDPNAPNAANTDESKANPYRDLPDPLVLKGGRTVTTAETWWNVRRPEIVEDFNREIYGRVPENLPRVNWEVTGITREMNGNVPVISKQLIGHVDNSSYPLINVDIGLTLTTPANATGPVPVMMTFGFNFPRAGRGAPGGPPRGAPDGTGPTWQQQVLAKGWGYAVLIPTSYQADNGAGLTQGIIGLANQGQPRRVDGWGALRAWAWGASRALDYFENDEAVDARQVGIEGLSRYGKAALVTMAFDPRFAIGFIGSSGAGGAKLHRRNFGEMVENVASSGEYHWMAGSFIKYAGPLTANDLPVDSHELIALCAPRPVFISVGSPQVEGNWIDSRGQFMAAVAAGPVYRLLGKRDLGTTEMPEIETPLISGDLAFRQHSGGHTTGPNWPTFLTFANRYIKGLSPAVAQVAGTSSK